MTECAAFDNSAGECVHCVALRQLRHRFVDVAKAVGRQLPGMVFELLPEH